MLFSLRLDARITNSYTALKSIFGSGERATKDNVLSALEAYIQDLHQVTEGLLAEG